MTRCNRDCRPYTGPNKLPSGLPQIIILHSRWVLFSNSNLKRGARCTACRRHRMREARVTPSPVATNGRSTFLYARHDANIEQRVHRGAAGSSLCLRRSADTGILLQLPRRSWLLPTARFGAWRSRALGLDYGRERYEALGVLYDLRTRRRARTVEWRREAAIARPGRVWMAVTRNGRGAPRNGHAPLSGVSPTVRYPHGVALRPRHVYTAIGRTQGRKWTD